MRGVLLLLVLGAAVPTHANQLTVDTRTLRMNDLASVTVSLEGGFAEVDGVVPPLENLATVGQPWVSTEFAWINGQVSRRKVFRFRVRPLAPGPARVGPMTVTGDDGAQQILPGIVLQVVSDRVLGSNDAESVLRDLLTSNREPVFVVSEVDRQTAYIGEPVRITWFLYNGVNVQEWQIVDVPPLQDFWTEEIPVRNEPPERVSVGANEIQRVPIRRVVVYPLRSGSLKIGGMTVEAAVMRRFRGGFWQRFEGEMVETSFTSAPVVIEAKPVPPGPPVDAVGDLVLRCEPPRQRNAGPVIVTVTLAGAGNLRGVAPPRFTERLAGAVQVEGGEVAASREEGSVAMSRRWRYLIFPSREGLLYVPPLAMTTFLPVTAERKQLRCEAATIEARASPLPAAGGSGPPPPPAKANPLRALPWVGGGALALLFAALGVPRARRELALRRRVQAMTEGKTPAQTRAEVESHVDPAILAEASDRGDAYRALRSLLDAAERERDIAAGAEDEIARRLRELLRIAG